MKFNRSGSARVIFASGLALALGASGCSDKKSEGTPPDGGGGGGKSKSNWTMQGWDIGSTFTNRDEKKLTRENVKDLKPIWERIHPTAGTPAIVDDVVYVAGGAYVAAYDVKTGNERWRSKNTTDPEIGVGTTGSPAYVDGHLYFLSGGYGWALSLNAADGSVEWHTKYETHQFASGYSSVIPVGDTLVFGNSSSEEIGVSTGATFKGSVVAIDRHSGEVKWNTPTATGSENGCAVWGSVAVDEKSVFAGTGNNYTEVAGPGSDAVFSFAFDGGAEKWRNQVTQGDVFTILAPKSPDTDFGANVIVYDFGGRKVVAGGQKSGDVYLFDRDSGERIQHRKLGPGSAIIGGVFQGLTFDGERLLVASNGAASDGPGSVARGPQGQSVLFALDPLSLDVIWERQLGANVWNPITTANGVGFVGAGPTLQAFNTETGEILNEWLFAGTITGGAAIANGFVCVQSGLSYLAGIRDNKFHCLGFEGGGTQTGNPATEPTFTNVYDQVIAGQRCNEALCHGSGKAGGLGMGSKEEAYDNLVGKPAAGTSDPPLASCNAAPRTRVVEGDPTTSLLEEKLTLSPPSCGERMPPTGEPIETALITLVRNWIAAGAKND